MKAKTQDIDIKITKNSLMNTNKNNKEENYYDIHNSDEFNTAKAPYIKHDSPEIKGTSWNLKIKKLNRHAKVR